MEGTYEGKEKDDLKKTIKSQYIRIFFLSILVVIVLILMILQQCSESNTNDIDKKNDTVEVLVLIPQEPDTIYMKGNIRWKTIAYHDTLIIDNTDTVYVSAPFVACMDTVTSKGDTLYVEYPFPENEFNFKLAYKPDSIRTIFITEHIPIERKKSFVEKYIIPAGYYCTGFFSGWFIFDKNK